MWVWVGGVRVGVCLIIFYQAIGSSNKYPLPLQNAKEAKILQNFGGGICKILDEKLQRYFRENGNKQMHLLLFEVFAHVSLVV